MTALRPATQAEVLEALRAVVAREGSYRAAARALGLADNTVGKIVRGEQRAGLRTLAPLGLAIPTPHRVAKPRYVRRPLGRARAPLTPEEIARARALRAEGATLSQIGAALDCTEVCVLRHTRDVVRPYSRRELWIATLARTRGVDVPTGLVRPFADLRRDVPQLTMEETLHSVLVAARRAALVQGVVA